jgi:hypothetical protein
MTADESVRESMLEKKGRTDRLLASLSRSGAHTLQSLLFSFGVGQYLVH